MSETKTPEEKAIETLKGVAKSLGYETLKTSAGVIQIFLPETVSFTNINNWRTTCVEVSSKTGVNIEDLLVSQDGRLVIATRIGRKRQRSEDTDAPSQRDLDDIEGKVDALIKKVLKTAPKDSIDASELDAAKKILQKATALLIGPLGANERAVQSFGLFQKKLTTADPRPRLLIAFRLNAGIPLSCKLLKQCLGICWADGAITTADSVSGIDSVQLPLTPEGEASRKHGNMPILVVSSIPIERRL